MQAAKERTQERFFVTTGADVSGRRITQVLGVVTAADVRSKNLLADVWTAFAGAFGGEAGYYTHLCNEASSAAADKAVHRAKVRRHDSQRLRGARWPVATCFLVSAVRRSWAPTRS